LRHTLVHDRGVHTLAVSRDGRTLLSGYFGSETQLWDLTTGFPRGTPRNHAGDVVSAAISPDGKFVLTGDWDGAKVWDVATGELRYEMLAHEVREDTVVGPVISPDGRTIATRSPLEGLRLWNSDNGKSRSESLPHGDVVWRIVSHCSQKKADRPSRSFIMCPIAPLDC
jgi:WD40 repeat protein